MRRLACFVMLGFLLLTAAANPAHARALALLIGVAGYDDDSHVAHLLGPRNDVTIMWRLLKGAGIKDEDMVVLADGIPATGDYPRVKARPTRAAILTAFADLAKRAGKDDFVYIHISSHGSEQPIQPGVGRQQQPGDRNQVMLPIDVGFSTDAKTILNGLPDYELGGLLDAVRAKAASVWIVLDMCHAGDATRGDLVARWVDPVDLGVVFPAQAPLRATHGDQAAAARGGSASALPLVDTNDRPGLAPLVAFFAVSPRDLSYEKSFPNYDPPLVGEDGKEDRLGVFTYLVHRALLSGNNRTYRDLRNQIMRDLNSGVAGAGMPLPMFDGNLDAPVFGTSQLDVRTGWPARYHDGVLDIAAGAVQGLIPESVVVVHKGTTDKAPEIARATVQMAQAATSRAALDAKTGGGDPGLGQGEDVWVTLSEEAVSFVYRISEPPADDQRRTENATVALAAVAKLKQDKVNREGIAAEWVPAGSDQADFRLRLKDGSVWITQATGALDTTVDDPNSSPGVRITDAQETADRLFDKLWSLARANNLVHLASRYPAGNMVAVSAEWYSVGASRPAARQDCPNVSLYEDLLRKPGIPMKPDEVREATHCDMVAVKLRNPGQKFVDAAVLYVDARGGVQAVDTWSASNGWEQNDCSIALPPRASADTLAAEQIVLWREGKASTAGSEYVVVVAAERPDGAAPTCFGALTQPTLEGARGESENGAARGQQSALQSLLNASVLAKPATRGSNNFRDQQLARSTMSAYTLDVTGNPVRTAVLNVPGRP